MPLDRLIFVGFELTDEVRKGFDDCPSRDRIYLNDPSYLEAVVIDGCEYIGKTVKSGAPIDRIEDTARSVVSLMARVSKKWEEDTNEILIIAVEDSQSDEFRASAGKKGPEDGSGYPISFD